MYYTSTPLTGPYDTQKLPRITVDPVTVVVERVPHPEHVNEFNVTLELLVEKASEAEDCLGATILKGATATDPYHVIFRFVDAITLRRWERDPQRVALIEKLDTCTISTSVVTAPSPKAWFEANDVPVENRVKKWFRDLIWALPLAFAMTFLAAPIWSHLPTSAKILISSAIGIVAYAIFVSPLRARWRKRVTIKRPLI